MNDHDAVYHRLFSHAGMVEDLLRGFVAEPWLNELDLVRMERINAKFHAEGALAVPEDLLEARTMLTTRAEEWKRQLLYRGRQEGEVAIVLSLLEHRFGTVPDWARERVAAAESAELQAWSRRLLEAKSLDDVFH